MIKPGELVEIASPTLGLTATIWATPDSNIHGDDVGTFTFGMVLGTYEEPIISQVTDRHEGNYDSWLLVIDSLTIRVGWLVAMQVRRAA